MAQKKKNIEFYKDFASQINQAYSDNQIAFSAAGSIELSRLADFLPFKQYTFAEYSLT